MTDAQKNLEKITEIKAERSELPIFIERLAKDNTAFKKSQAFLLERMGFSRIQIERLLQIETDSVDGCPLDAD